MEIEITGTEKRKQSVRICKRNGDSLMVIETRKLTVTTNFNDFSVTCKLNGIVYPVQGNFQALYILIEGAL